MRNIPVTITLILALLFAGRLTAFSQAWNFAKEKDGIKLYTRQEAGKALKSYKGITDINAPAEKVFALLEDVNHTEWWDKNISTIRVMKYEKNKMARYYLVYDLPWPVTNRDLCVNVTVTIDTGTGERKIIAVPLAGVVPENKEMIRITEYRQTWTVRPIGDKWSHVELEGYVDPSGTIPDWLSNMLIVDSPFKIMDDVKKRTEK